MRSYRNDSEVDDFVLARAIAGKGFEIGVSDYHIQIEELTPIRAVLKERKRGRQRRREKPVEMTPSL